MDADSWHGVTDTRERKRIQDRLAQRARRQRLREKHAASSPKSRHITARTFSADIGTLDLTPHPASRKTTPLPGPMSPLTNPSLFTALWTNGHALGLKCGVIIPHVSSPPTSSTPPSLRPTLLQMTTLHAPWIDRLPFPRMRENMINLTGLIDDEEFLGDLFMLPSFVVDLAVGESWDPTTWKLVGEEWRRKWGFLLEGEGQFDLHEVFDV